MTFSYPQPATVQTRDGLALVLRHWPAAFAAPRAGGAADAPPPAQSADSRGLILLVHGLGEHIGRYERVAAHLTALGWAVCGYDHRGHGRSPGTRGALSRADDLLDDLARVLEAVRPAAGPVVLFGHSMGGLVAAQFVAEGRGAVEALVLSSPALDAALSVAQRVQLAVGLALVPSLPMGNQLDPQMLSHDAAVVQAYLADPLVHDRITARLARALVDGGEMVRARASTWTVPTLLLWGGADRIVAPRGSAAFAAAAPPSVVTARCFDGFYHEILNEPRAAEVYAELERWRGGMKAR